jgi:hypothetical protein
MSKFKVGDEIVRINNLRHDIKIGFKTIVEPHYYYMAPTGEFIKIIDKNWKLSKPKWTIYNNTLPWSDLSDKQKGKLLLAAHARVEIIGLGMLSIPKPVVFNCGIIAYQAVKPELAMAEVFVSDWSEQESIYKIDVANRMIAKGWIKP